MKTHAPSTILAHFHQVESSLLGQGGEAWVYALDADRVLRVFKGDKPEEAAERAAFFARLAQFRFPFAVPELLESGEIDGTFYTIERRLAGRPLNQFLLTLLPGSAARRTVLQNFLDAIEALATARWERAKPTVDSEPKGDFGEVFGRDQVRGATWPEFLRRRVEGVLTGSASYLIADVPDLPALRARFDTDLESLPPIPTPYLVHGDYYPANVLIGDALSLTAVIDFSRLTVAGDPDLDRAAAYLFLDSRITPEADDTDRAFVREQLLATRGEGLLQKFTVYQTYYALLFSDCLLSDPNTYYWCVQFLNQRAQELGR